MKSAEIRQIFLNYFSEKGHQIVHSAPMVLKNDPTLMFTNAGMNQFKDIFLGNTPIKHRRVANTQKCLRVSGKHNDLEEVGHDTYHHTMFEMFGNWSFGDYFKKEAIIWSWELLTEVYKIDKERLYVTVFSGDEKDGLPADEEAYKIWSSILPPDRILYGSRKDNFWEMGETGPCGPCSEIHIDIRDKKEREKVNGKDLVNKDHSQVIEIWNLVFIEFNRKSNGELVSLPAKHIDTGLGFERLCMILQQKKSNYDTDIFQPVIREIARVTGREYGKNDETDIAMRVVADHLRAITFAIADGQLPSNVGAGYVIRRILRRAVRYAYTFLGISEPFINKLVPVLINTMGDTFPEIKAQHDLIIKVITEEEFSFLRTLSQGIRKFDQYIQANPKKKFIDGHFAFELFDTYGFPVDLTQLMAKEKGYMVDMDGFQKGLEAQKNRSRMAASKEKDDWVILKESGDLTKFLGYDQLETDVNIVRYRKITAQNKTCFEIILDKTPFYPESGGQAGDSGILIFGEEKISVIDTKKENNLIIHITTELPHDPRKTAKAVVNKNKRELTANNHSVTHLLHYAMRKVLGEHVEQKGSLVDADHLRFDFSHFQKVTNEELRLIESIVNKHIRLNIPLDEKRSLPISEAKQMGALAFFGEKYDDEVRVIKFGDSVELCGGTHVDATGCIGLFKIVSEGAIAAGIRRIEAITADKAEEYINNQVDIITKLKKMFKTQKDIVKGVENLFAEYNQLQKEINQLKKEKVIQIEDRLKKELHKLNGVNFLALRLEEDNALIKDIAFSMLMNVENLFLLIGSVSKGKAFLTLAITQDLIENRSFNAGNIIKDLATEINGSGGGQPHFATAGGNNVKGLDKAFLKARDLILSQV